MIRIAAVSDVHFGEGSAGTMSEAFEELSSSADLLLLAGDFTRHGNPREAEVFAREVSVVEIDTVAVLGNHDYHADAQGPIRSILEDAGVRVLEGEATVVETDGARVAIAGTKGFGGGFAGANATEFGEPEMKAFVRHTRELCEGLETALSSVRGDLKIALLHYSPVEATLVGERLEIYPFLGSYLLAEAIDRVGADLVLHGHAHSGSHRGVTPGGAIVRNVALPVIQRPYIVVSLEENGREVDPEAAGHGAEGG